MKKILANANQQLGGGPRHRRDDGAEGSGGLVGVGRAQVEPEAGVVGGALERDAHAHDRSAINCARAGLSVTLRLGSLGAAGATRRRGRAARPS